LVAFLVLGPFTLYLQGKRKEWGCSFGLQQCVCLQHDFLTTYSLKAHHMQRHEKQATEIISIKAHLKQKKPF